MATKSRQEIAENEDPTVLGDGEGDEFETVADESPTSVIMTTAGDTLIGVYEGAKDVVPAEGQNFKPFTQHLFRHADGTLYSMADTYQLSKALDPELEGRKVRITLVSKIDTGKPEPMKNYRVEVAKKR